MREPPLQVTAFIEGEGEGVSVSRPIPSPEEAGTVSASLFRELTDAGRTVSRMVVSNSPQFVIPPYEPIADAESLYNEMAEACAQLGVQPPPF